MLTQRARKREREGEKGEEKEKGDRNSWRIFCPRAAKKTKKRRGKWERRRSVKPERREKGEKKKRGKKGRNALTRARASEERTYRDVNQLVIKISEGFALNGPVTFIRPRFFDELSRERAPRLTSSGALSVFRHSRGLQFTHIRCRFPLMLLRPSAAFSPLLLNARCSYDGRASSSSSTWEATWRTLLALDPASYGFHLNYRFDAIKTFTQLWRNLFKDIKDKKSYFVIIKCVFYSNFAYYCIWTSHLCKAFRFSRFIN